ncbi:ROK family protein [Aquipuribacter hungaricus]|uniref:ROK family protein n=1 Tax=Aquipuribacter hungaricus TaxID=545624 RepID=A0ABV7WLK8_9MICO
MSFVDLGGWHGLSEPSRGLALEVLLHGPLSRSDVARRLEMSAGSVTRLSRPLLDAGVLVEGGGPYETTEGRPGRPLHVATDAVQLVGLRVAGTHAWATLTTLRADAVDAVDAPLPDTSPEAVADTALRLVERLRRSAPPVAGVGVAVGGTVDGHGIVVRAPFLGWNDVPFGRMLEDRTGLPVTLANDIVALTTAESWFGVGSRHPTFAVVTVGTGVGLGLVYDRRVVTGPDTGVGLVGHLPLGMHGPVCDLGHRGCAAAVLSDASIRNQVSIAVGRPVDAEDVLDLVLAGQHPAVDAIAEHVAVGLGRLIAMVANITMVPVVAVSGEGLALAELLQHRVHREVARLRDPHAADVDIVFQHSPGSRWARGAAAVAIKRYVSPTT